MENFLAAIGLGGLVFIIVAVCLEILLRTFFNKPQIWVIEFTEYALLYITFLGTAWLQHRDGHVAVDLVTNALGDRWRRRFALLSAALGFLVSVVLTVFGTTATWGAMAQGLYKPTVIEFPTWIVLAIIPVGSLVLALRFAHRVLMLWSAIRTGDRD
jgi:C4-dicarboxylate transporter DctQ subunit